MKEARPVVSVILPNYNHSQFLDKRLESIYNQTVENIEVILLDDCSTDSSREILSHYKDHLKTAHTLFNQKNSGSTFIQWNKGLKLAKGKYVWIAESDDYSDFKFLEKVIKPLEKDPNIAFSFCQSHSVNSCNQITGNWLSHTSGFPRNIFVDSFVLDGNIFIQEYLIHKNVVPNVSGVLFRKRNLLKIMPLEINSFMKYNADWFYYIQLACNSKVAFVAEALNFFRYHHSSVIARAGGESGWTKIFKMELKGRRHMLSYIQSCGPPNFKEIKKQAAKGDLKLQYLTARGYIERQEILKGVGIACSHPLVFKRILKHIANKTYRSCMKFQ